MPKRNKSYFHIKRADMESAPTINPRVILERSEGSCAEMKQTLQLHQKGELPPSTSLTPPCRREAWVTLRTIRIHTNNILPSNSVGANRVRPQQIISYSQSLPPRVILEGASRPKDLARKQNKSYFHLKRGTPSVIFLRKCHLPGVGRLY